MSDEVDRARALTFAAALLSNLPPEQVDPALTDGPTEAERLLATVVTRGVVEGGARACTHAPRKRDRQRRRRPGTCPAAERRGGGVLLHFQAPLISLRPRGGRPGS